VFGGHDPARLCHREWAVKRIEKRHPDITLQDFVRNLPLRLVWLIVPAGWLTRSLALIQTVSLLRRPNRSIPFVSGLHAGDWKQRRVSSSRGPDTAPGAVRLRPHCHL
jgi:hypothetical protein